MRRVDTSAYSPPAVSPHLRSSPQAKNLYTAGSPLRLTTSDEGEHFAILQLMKDCLFPHHESDVQSQQERPGYDLRERLTFRLGNQIIGHIRCVPDEVRLQGAVTPFWTASEFVFAPEYADAANIAAFFHCLDQAFDTFPGAFMIHRTSAAMAQRLARFGWVTLSPNFRSTASCQRFLASFRGQQAPPERITPLATPQPGLWIRLMRQVEADALVSLYDTAYHTTQIGTPRSAALWDWILRRKAFDALYVAIRGGNKLAWDDAIERMAGYAIVHNGHILELVTQPHETDVKAPLIGRICSDLYEAAQTEIALEAPAADPIHALLRDVGGAEKTSPGEQLLVRMPKPWQRLAELCPLLQARAKAQGLELPLDLGLLVDGEKFSIHLGTRKGMLTDGKLGRSYLELTRAQLVRLLLADLPIAELVDQGEMAASTQIALQTATRLFPYNPPWFPAAELLPMR